MGAISPCVRKVPAFLSSPLVFDLLQVLVSRSRVVVARDERIEQVWKGRLVSDATVASCMRAARCAPASSHSCKGWGCRAERQRGLRHNARRHGKFFDSIFVCIFQIV
jgi:hypothetical protein